MPVLFIPLTAQSACLQSGGFWAPSGFVSVLAWGAVGDGITDDTIAIQCAVSAGGNIWVPSGTYKITANILFPTNLGLRIKGQTDSTTPALFKGAVSGLILGDNAYNSSRTAATSVEDMFFDGIALKAYATQSLITFQRNVFSNKTGFGTYQAVISYGKANSILKNNIFLQNPGIATAVTLYKTKTLTVSQNIVGLRLDNLSWLTTWPGYVNWSNESTNPTYSQYSNPPLVTLDTKLTTLKNNLLLDNNQGKYLAGLYTGGDTNLVVDGNIFNADPATTGTRDHASYLKGTSGSYIRNWVSGWPNNEFGGIKARNLANLVIGANYVKDTPILLYVYNEATYPMTLDNVDVCGNTITVSSPQPPPANHQGIWFMENVHPISISNILIYSNTISDFSHQVGAVMTYQSPVTGLYASELAAFSIYTTNVFADNLATVPIWPTTKLPVSGSPAVNKCAGLTTPSYSIPPY